MPGMRGWVVVVVDWSALRATNDSRNTGREHEPRKRRRTRAGLKPLSCFSSNVSWIKSECYKMVHLQTHSVLRAKTRRRGSNPLRTGCAPRYLRFCPDSQPANTSCVRGTDCMP
jgi:hypothetical protein